MTLSDGTERGNLRYYDNKNLLASLYGANSHEAATEVDTQQGIVATLGVKNSNVKVITKNNIEKMDSSIFSQYSKSINNGNIAMFSCCDGVDGTIESVTGFANEMLAGLSKKPMLNFV